MIIQKLIEFFRPFSNIRIEHWIDEIEYPPTWCLNVYSNNVRIFDIREKIEYGTEPSTIEAKVCKHIHEEIILEGLRSLELDSRLNLPKK